MEIRKIYKYALHREYEDKPSFERNTEWLKHAAMVDALKQLAGEEQRHLAFIPSQNGVLDKVEKQECVRDVALEQSGLTYHGTESETLDLTILEAMVPDLPVLRMAYLIEQGFAEFYEMAAGKTEGGKEMYDKC